MTWKIIRDDGIKKNLITEKEFFNYALEQCGVDKHLDGDDIFISDACNSEICLEFYPTGEFIRLDEDEDEDEDEDDIDLYDHLGNPID